MEIATANTLQIYAFQLKMHHIEFVAFTIQMRMAVARRPMSVRRFSIEQKETTILIGQRRFKILIDQVCTQNINSKIMRAVGHSFYCHSSPTGVVQGFVF